MTKESDGGTNIQGNQQNISGQVTGPVVGGNVGQIGDNYYQQPQPSRALLQRPARADHFQDRKAELAQLLADLRPGAVITLSGPGGMGKSALAAEAVWHLAPEDQPGDQPPPRFPDGIFFHSFYNQPAVDAACEQIARAFGFQAKGSPRENARLALAGRRALLILDGAEDADDLPALLDLRDNCGVLITSRDRRVHTGSRTDLPPLSPEDAVVLIRAWAGQNKQAQEPADPAMAEIAALVGHLPMALRLVGSYLDESAETPTAYLAWLGRSPLTALDQGQRRMQSADILLERTVARLSDDERGLLAVAGLLAFAPVDAEIIAHALEREVDDLRPVFNKLIRFSLLVRDGEGRYQTTHALVHTYARLRLTPPPDALERLAAHYALLAKELSSQGLAGYRALEPHRPHLLALMERCHAAESWDALSSLVWAVENTWIFRVIQLSGSPSYTWASSPPRAGGIGRMKAHSWAIWAVPTKTWGRWKRPSSTTLRHWSSAAKSATAKAKATTWAIWARPTQPWGKRRRPEPSGSKHWSSLKIYTLRMPKPFVPGSPVSTVYRRRLAAGSLHPILEKFPCPTQSHSPN
jgi:hypothetical protein